MSAAVDERATPSTFESAAPTSPAPARDGPTTDVPSNRPTSVPSWDPSLASLASQARALRHGNSSQPMDLSVPVLLARDDRGLGHRDAFILMHVDGVSTVREIAKSAGLPIHDVIETLLMLVALGAVGMNDWSSQPSGVHERVVFDDE